MSRSSRGRKKTLRDQYHTPFPLYATPDLAAGAHDVQFRPPEPARDAPDRARERAGPPPHEPRINPRSPFPNGQLPGPAPNPVIFQPYLARFPPAFPPPALPYPLDAYAQYEYAPPGYIPHPAYAPVYMPDPYDPRLAAPRAVLPPGTPSTALTVASTPNLASPEPASPERAAADSLGRLARSPPVDSYAPPRSPLRKKRSIQRIQQAARPESAYAGSDRARDARDVRDTRDVRDVRDARDSHRNVSRDAHRDAARDASRDTHDARDERDARDAETPCEHEPASEQRAAARTAARAGQPLEPPGMGGPLRAAPPVLYSQARQQWIPPSWERTRPRRNEWAIPVPLWQHPRARRQSSSDHSYVDENEADEQTRSQQARNQSQKNRYTAEENLFILRARNQSKEQKIPWNLIPDVTMEHYQVSQNRNARNMQVHFSQNVNSRMKSTSELTKDEYETYKAVVEERLQIFYDGVREEFKKLNHVELKPGLPEAYTRFALAASKRRLLRALRSAERLKHLQESRKKPKK